MAVFFHVVAFGRKVRRALCVCNLTGVFFFSFSFLLFTPFCLIDGGAQKGAGRKRLLQKKGVSTQTQWGKDRVVTATQLGRSVFFLALATCTALILSESNNTYTEEEGACLTAHVGTDPKKQSLRLTLPPLSSPPKNEAL